MRYTQFWKFSEDLHFTFDKKKGIFFLSGFFGNTTIHLKQIDPHGEMLFFFDKSNQSLTLHSQKKALLQSITTLFKSWAKGVNQGFQKNLVLTGIGYRWELESNVQLNQKALVLFLGQSHPLRYIFPPSVDVFLPSKTKCILFGIDKQKVNQIAADLQSMKKLDPYKGKGISVENQFIRLKGGKKK